MSVRYDHLYPYIQFQERDLVLMHKSSQESSND